jgi:uncharacterized membrane protein YoaK (UPF0700 family)
VHRVSSETAEHASGPGTGSSAAYVLSAVAGAVDGLGYVVLFQLFTAHITGNTVKSGSAFGAMHFGQALRDGFPIAVFVAGVILGASLRGSLERHAVRAPRAVVLSLGLALLLAFIAGGAALGGGRFLVEDSAEFYGLAALATLAMGVQNAAKSRVGGSNVRTFITGTISDFGEAVAAALVAHVPGQRRAHLRRASLLLGVWMAYFGGGAVASGAAVKFGTASAALPAAGLAVAIALELRSTRAVRRDLDAGGAF